MTGVRSLGYPVDFPNGETGDAVLLIHDTEDKVMDQLRKDGEELLKRMHRFVLEQMKNNKGNYRIGKPLWKP